MGEFAHEVGGVVGATVDFFDNDAPFFFNIFGEKCGVKEHIGEEGGAFLEVVGERNGVIEGVFSAGSGVDLRADAFGLVGYLESGAGGGALKEHVLSEMGNAVRRRVFKGGARADEYA